MEFHPIDTFGEQVASFQGMLESIVEERKNQKFLGKKKGDGKRPKNRRRREPSPEPVEVSPRSRSSSIHSSKSMGDEYSVNLLGTEGAEGCSAPSQRGVVKSMHEDTLPEPMIEKRKADSDSDSVSEESQQGGGAEEKKTTESILEEASLSPLQGVGADISPMDWLRGKLEGFGISETVIKYGAMPFAIFVSVLFKLIFYFATRSQKVVRVRAITKNSNACVLIDEENKHYRFEEDTILRWFGIQTMNRTLWRDIHEGQVYKLYLSGGSFVHAVEVA